MTIPTITPLPTPPSRADAAAFASRADTFLGSLPTFQAEMNAASAAIDALFFPPTLRNRLINGAFTLWTRGTSQTSSGYGSDDRWRNEHVGASKTHSRQAMPVGQTGVAGEAAFFSRTVVTSVAGASNFVRKTQRIEGVRAFAGKTVRLSFDVKTDATRAVSVELVQNFGTGGTPSAAVTGIGSAKITTGTAWARAAVTIAVPSLAGKTIGTNGDDYLELVIWYDAGSSFNSRTATLGHQSGTFDVGAIQIEEGTSETAFENRPIALEQHLAQRYYQAGNYAILFGAYATGAYGQVQIVAPVPMRAAPALSVSTGFSAATNAPTTANIAASSWLIRTTATGANVAAESTGTYTADAEL
jgi:hypothetical protein